MKVKYYLLGLGIGILVTTLVLSFGEKKEKLSDDEIIARARELGMVMKDETEDKLEEVIEKSLGKAEENYGELSKDDNKTGSDAETDVNNENGKNSDDVTPLDEVAISEAGESGENQDYTITDRNNKEKNINNKGEITKEENTNNKEEIINNTEKSINQPESADTEKTAVTNKKPDENMISKDTDNNKMSENKTVTDGKLSEDKDNNDNKLSADKDNNKEEDLNISGNVSETESASEDANKKGKSKAEYITFTITRGMTSYEVAKLLYKVGMIDDVKGFDTYVINMGKSRVIRAGRYTLSKGASYKEILDTIIIK